MGPVSRRHGGMLRLVFTIMLEKVFSALEMMLCFWRNKGEAGVLFVRRTARFSQEIRFVLRSILYPDELSILVCTKEENGRVWFAFFVMSLKKTKQKKTGGPN